MSISTTIGDARMTVRIVDPVADYAAPMETLFDFDASARRLPAGHHGVR